MKFLTDSKHGQELVILAGLIAAVAVFFFLRNYQRRLYEPGETACVADCTEIKGNYRRYNHNIFSADQCICLLDQQISNIWN